MVDKLKEKTDALKRAVGERVRDLRRRAGFSGIEAAAERMGVHPNSVGDIERGANFLSPEMTVRMIEAYRLADGGPLLGESSVLSPTPQEALAVIARELETRRETPARDPLAERVAKLGPDARRALEALLPTWESAPASQEPRQHDGKPRERGK